MSDQAPTSSEQNRLKFATLEARLAECSEAAREIVVNVLRDRCVSTTLATELSMLQTRLQAHVMETRRLLGEWPQER